MIKRDNSQKRKFGSRKPRDRVLVVCCGAKTEKLYLEGMRRYFRESRLCRHVPGYDKTKIDFDVFAPGIPDAIVRGRKLSDAGTDHRDNPSTTMWRLANFVDG